MEANERSCISSTSGAEALLKRGNWKTTVEGWAFWATEYNRLLVDEGKHEEVLRLDIISDT